MVVTTRLSPQQVSRLVHLKDDPKKLKQYVAKAIEQALDEGLDPVIEPVPRGEGLRLNMSLPNRIGRDVAAMAFRLDEAKGNVCRGLLESWMRRHPFSAEDAVQKVLAPQYVEAAQTFGWTTRLPQNEVFETIMKALNERRIAMVEAATGVGKTHAMLLAATEIVAARSEARVVIATPTLALIEHFRAVHAAMRDAKPDLPALITISGRQEFVSSEAIKAALDEGLYNDEAGEVQHWLDNGGRAPVEDERFCWKAESLRRIAPDFPVADVLLTPDASENDPGTLAYEAQFTAEAPIIVCSHAMLAVDTRIRMGRLRSDKEIQGCAKDLYEKLQALLDRLEEEAGDRRAIRKEIECIRQEIATTEAEAAHKNDLGRLPPYNYLLIDEAHQLESAFSNTLSDYVSLRKTAIVAARHHADFKRASGLTKQRVQRLEELVDGIATAIENADGDTVVVTRTTWDIRNRAAEMVDILHDAKRPSKDMTLRQQQRWRELLHARSRLRAALEAPYLLATYSPVRRYPRLVFGRPNVADHLRFLWGGVEGAACLSATLYLPVAGAFSEKYQRECLALPSGRLLTHTPIIPPWVAGQVEGVWQPADHPADGNGDRRWLQPPAMRNRLDKNAWQRWEEAWLREVSETLGEIDRTAKGGVLVLMTAYQAAETLGDLLREQQPEIAPRLIVASRRESLEAQRQRYLFSVAQGLRPLWIAVGGAWTGMDISADAYRKVVGEPPDEDWILTDLVIPRIPLGTNKTITHRYRMERRPRGGWEVHHAMFLLRQGLGRLVRNEGLPGGRRIFLLDSRIHDPDQKSLAARVTRVLDSYEKRVLGKPPAL